MIQRWARSPWRLRYDAVRWLRRGGTGEMQQGGGRMRREQVGQLFLTNGKQQMFKKVLLCRVSVSLPECKAYNYMYCSQRNEKQQMCLFVWIDAQCRRISSAEYKFCWGGCRLSSNAAASFFTAPAGLAVLHLHPTITSAKWQCDSSITIQ